MKTEGLWDFPHLWGWGREGPSPQGPFRKSAGFLPSVGKTVRARVGIQEGSRPSPETIGEEGLPLRESGVRKLRRFCSSGKSMVPFPLSVRPLSGSCHSVSH